MKRSELLKKAGKMVTIYYHSEEKKCFAIGWFYALNTETVKLKVTSTRNETYESIELPFDQIEKIEDYDIN